MVIPGDADGGWQTGSDVGKSPSVVPCRHPDARRWKDGSSASQVYLSPVRVSYRMYSSFLTESTIYSWSIILRSTKSLSLTRLTGDPMLRLILFTGCFLLCKSDRGSGACLRARSPVTNRQVSEIVHRDRELYGRQQGAERVKDQAPDASCWITLEICPEEAERANNQTILSLGRQRQHQRKIIQPHSCRKMYPPCPNWPWPWQTKRMQHGQVPQIAARFFQALDHAFFVVVVGGTRPHHQMFQTIDISTRTSTSSRWILDLSQRQNRAYIQYCTVQLQSVPA